MKQSSRVEKPSSFAETVELAENYVRREIVRETKDKQLFYHTLDHAFAVKRRANLIFREIKPVLEQDIDSDQLDRLQLLMNLSALAHDMVQEFVPPEKVSASRKHLVGISEAATAIKLIEYLKDLNQELERFNLEPSILFSQQDFDILEDAILATICALDPQAGKASYSFSPYSIYQPYLYDPEQKVSVIGSVIALADLGTLAMDGIKPFIQDGILIFLEDNPDLKDFFLKGEYESCRQEDQKDISLECDLAKTRLLNMTRFMVNLAKERYARLELEVAGFSPQIRQILKEQVFTYLSQKNIQKLVLMAPTEEDTSLPELIDFFYLSN